MRVSLYPVPVVALCVLLTSVPAGCATCPSRSTPDSITIETPLRQPIAPDIAPGREAIMQVIDIPPRSSIPRHWHPGEEYLYCLEGEAEVFIDGQEPVTVTPGMGINLPYRVWHSASTGEIGCKVVVFRVHTIGEPIMITDGDRSSSP